VSDKWLREKERGSGLGIRFVLGLTRLGRRPAIAFVRFLMIWYTLSHAPARRASRNFLRRVGRPSGLWAVYKHLSTFGVVTVDRLLFAQGRFSAFELEANGSELLDQLDGRGALLLGAHVGSFDALRARAAATARGVYFLAYLDNAQKLQKVLSAVDPELANRVIPIGDVQSMLRVQELVDSGALVALLGDRVGLSERKVMIPFLGEPAAFPTGPYQLAALLKCPVFFVQGVFEGGNRYTVRCERFAERIDLPRGPARDDAMRQWAGRYAARVQEVAAAHPENWFNLYDFWGSEDT